MVQSTGQSSDLGYKSKAFRERLRWQARRRASINGAEKMSSSGCTRPRGRLIVAVVICESSGAECASASSSSAVHPYCIPGPEVVQSLFGKGALSESKCSTSGRGAQNCTRLHCVVGARARPDVPHSVAKMLPAGAGGFVSSEHEALPQRHCFSRRKGRAYRA